MHTSTTFVRTRKVSLNDVERISKWLEEHAVGKVVCKSTTAINQAFQEGRSRTKKIHVLKMEFFNHQDAHHFLLEWG